MATPNTAQGILFYLTLDGKISQHESIDNLASGTDYYCLSYKQEIITFLNSCLSELSDATHLRVVIEHYIDLIKDLTMKEDVHEKIIDLIINSKENYQSAQLISSQLKLAQNKIQKDFWIKLYKKMQVEFETEKSELANDAYADESNLFEVVESYPTLFVKKEVEVNSQKRYLSIAIQLGKRSIYFGFPDTIANPKYGNSDAKFQEDVKTHLAGQSMKSDKWWLGWKYFNCHQIDFSSHENISNEIIHDIVNELKSSLYQLEEYFAKNL